MGLGTILGCGDDIVEPPIDMPPRATMESISPVSGMSPLEVTARYTCEDDKGIKSYKIVKNGEIIRDGSTPIDSIVIFMEDGNLREGCTDTGNQTTWYPRGGPKDIQVSQPPAPSYSQIANLTNYVDIDYTATLTNVSEATRKTIRNDTLINTKTITGPNYSETLEDMAKGDYVFVLEADGVKPDTATTNVPDYESEAPDFSGLNLDVNERDSIEVHLPRATDKNTRDNPVPYKGVTPSGVEASLGEFPDDTVLTIKAPEISGPDPVPYSIELAREGSPDKITLEGRVLDVAESGLIWVRNIDFGRGQEGARVIGITPSDQIVVAGFSVSGAPVYGVLGGLDSNGNVKWTRELEQGVGILDIIPSNRNSLFVTGSDGGPPAIRNTLCGEIDGEGTFIIDPILNKFKGTGGMVMQYFNNRIYIGEDKGYMAIADSDCSFLERLTLRENSRISGLSISPDYILASGDFKDTEGAWNVAGFVRKLDRDGNLLWERIYDDALQLRLVEQDGMIYVGSVQLTSYPNSWPMFISQLDQNGSEQWNVSWDGDLEPIYTREQFANSLIPNPSGGVVLIPQLGEIPSGNPDPICCHDFGAWAVGPAGNTLWTLRKDLVHNSFFDISNDAVFDSEGNLIVAGVGGSGDNVTVANSDVTVAKFRIR